MQYENITTAEPVVKYSFLEKGIQTPRTGRYKAELTLNCDNIHYQSKDSKTVCAIIVIFCLVCLQKHNSRVWVEKLSNSPVEYLIS